GDPLYPSEKAAIDQLETNLKAALNGTGNLYSGANDIVRNGNVIYIPGNQTRPIKLDSNGDSGFVVTITDWLGEIVVKVQGKYGSTSSPLARAISLDFTRKPHESNIYDFAVASKGTIRVKKGAITSTSGVSPSIAKMMSAMEG